MAIEVLRPGFTSKDITYTAECLHCTAELRFTGADGAVTSDQREGSLITITCPCCGTAVTTAAVSPKRYAEQRTRAEANNRIDPY